MRGVKDDILRFLSTSEYLSEEKNVEIKKIINGVNNFKIDRK